MKLLKRVPSRSEMELLSSLIKVTLLGMERLFRSTMSGLETGLRVGQIATFTLVLCSADEDASDVLEDPARYAFDRYQFVTNHELSGCWSGIKCSGVECAKA